LWQGWAFRLKHSGFKFYPSSLSPSWWLTLLTLGMMILMQLIFFAYSRYRLPFLCLLLPTAADGWMGRRSTIPKIPL